VYSGNNIKQAKIAGGAEARVRGAFCLEPEFYPDSVNQGGFPSPILFPGKKFYAQIVFKCFW
jgi:aldose 1-epimerase